MDLFLVVVLLLALLAPHSGCHFAQEEQTT